MKRAKLLLNLCRYAHTRVSHRTLTTRFNSNSNPLLVSLSESTRPRLRFYSSEFESPARPNSDSQIHKAEPSGDVEGVSNEELKRLIERYYGGDQEVIPSIFEAILSRKLAGKYEKEDEELMQEIMGGRPSESFDDEEFDSDLDELSDTDDDEEEEESD